ncbi:aromatic amino acid lyase, partial [Hyphococcus sp.]|uniref:aromatic amino acid lyase n=1 Tax=Hyphococcus sp. TaxID=2038636 RepID=UPI0035C77CC3
MSAILTPGGASLASLESLYRSHSAFELDRSARAAIDRSAKQIAKAAAGDAPVYGVNTGFGKLASVRVGCDEVAQLQRNLILSHSAGTGAPLSPEVTRLVMALKLLSLGRGASGVRWSLIEQVEKFIAADILPVIPSQGSVGASGDLAPLAHMTAALIGEGDVFHRGEKKAARDAMAAENIEPLVLSAKEGLAMINGTQVSTALALSALFDAWRLALSSITASALSIEAAMGTAATATMATNTAGMTVVTGGATMAMPGTASTVGTGIITTTNRSG